MTNSKLLAMRVPLRLSSVVAMLQSLLLVQAPADTLSTFDSNLPLLLIETLGPSVPANERIMARFSLAEPRGNRASPASPPRFLGSGPIWVRGASSRSYAKKPYRFEFQDDSGRDRKVSMLGLPAGSDWILYASVTDRTFIRDALAYELWREMGHYAPRTRYVEVFTNDILGRVEERDYAGLYVLMEKVKRSSSRVHLQKLTAADSDEPEIGGGYIIKKDRYRPGDKGFLTTRGVPFLFDEPHSRDLTTAQERWLTNHVNELERCLLGENFRDPTNGYARYIDVDSFVDYHWMVGRIYYTLDGSDPRLRGGEPSLASREATNTLTCRFPAVLTARVRSEYNLWSAPLFVHP